jgi:hypothetical protein
MMAKQSVQVSVSPESIVLDLDRELPEYCGHGPSIKTRKAAVGKGIPVGRFPSRSANGHDWGSGWGWQSETEP